MGGWALLLTQQLVWGPRHHVPRLDVRCHTLDKENGQLQKGLAASTRAGPGTLAPWSALLCDLSSHAASPYRPSPELPNELLGDCSLGASRICTGSSMPHLSI